MAQPVFDDEGPLDDYLRESDLDLMPGTLPEYAIAQDSSHELPPWIPVSLISFCRVRSPFSSYRALQGILGSSVLTPSVFPSPSQSLETLLCPPMDQPTGRQFAERFKYIIISSSLLSTFLSPAPSCHDGPLEPETLAASDLEAGHVPLTTSAMLLFLVAPISLASGHWIIALAAVLLAKFYFESSPLHHGDSQLQTRSTLHSLQLLVDADTAWESAIGEAMALLRRDEASGSIQWQTPLRVALQSGLQAVTNHVDRVRQLFSPLTNPDELAQMSEMYAPPSPSPSHQQLFSPTMNIRKSASSSKLDKRITWSGATAKQLARKSVDPNSIFPRPGSPIPPVPSLPRGGSPSDGSEDTPFGALALEFQKSPVTPQRHSLATPRSAGSLRPSPTAASRFTAMQSLRNPLSIHSLDAALQGALASKRFSCSHLLALRFDEEEDDLYWEDVRSVMSLLSTSLEDEAARLSEAMDEWHKSRQRDARPSTVSTPLLASIPPSQLPQRTRRQLTSFAPQSSSMVKATEHAEFIAGALDRAFGELENCVSSLHRHESTDSDDADSLEHNNRAIMSAYESLRKELGLALRECERIRSPILAVLTDHNEDGSSEADEASTTVHGHDPISELHQQEDQFPPDSPTRVGASSPPPAYASRGPSQIVDDATAHLLAGATAMELPPPGVERVFEAESGPTIKPYLKERSTLSRAERIALAQAKRKSVRMGNSPSQEDRTSGQQLPLAGDVVEELKQVINRVNERKQRMAVLPARKTPTTSDASYSQYSSTIEAVATEGPDGAILQSRLPATTPS